MDGSPRILLALPLLPHDPAVGAARSLTTICELLAANGFTVRCTAAAASQQSSPVNLSDRLASLGVEVSSHEIGGQVEFSYVSRGIAYRLVSADTAATNRSRFDKAFEEELSSFHPHLVFTYGFSEEAHQRRFFTRKQGIKLVYGLRSEAELQAPALEEVDAFLTPSTYLSNLYRSERGIDSTAIPSPMQLDEVVAEEREPIFATMVNPSSEKGVTFLARLADDLSVRRPDIPFLIVESRGSAGLLASVALAGGFDLRRHENIMVSPAVNFPRDIYQPTRILLVPSLWREAFGRVVAEALLNGIPPIVSNRGGLPETCGGAGFVLDIPESITPFDKMPVEPNVVRPWVDLIIRLFDDEDFYQEESRKARAAGKRYLPEVLVPQYLDFFRKVLRD